MYRLLLSCDESLYIIQHNLFFVKYFFQLFSKFFELDFVLFVRLTRTFILYNRNQFLSSTFSNFFKDFLKKFLRCYLQFDKLVYYTTNVVFCQVVFS